MLTLGALNTSGVNTFTGAIVLAFPALASYDSAVALAEREEEAAALA